MINQIFVNLPVRDLKKSMGFFSALGFKFDPTFTDKNAACLILGKNIYAMLLVEKFFKTFTQKDLCATAKSIETMLAVSVGNRKAVDAMLKKALKSGGKEPREPEDHGWMYGRDFEDLDGHTWEVFTMDVKAMKKAQ